MLKRIKELLFPTPPAVPAVAPDLIETDTPIYARLAIEYGRTDW